VRPTEARAITGTTRLRLHLTAAASGLALAACADAPATAPLAPTDAPSLTAGAADTAYSTLPYDPTLVTRYDANSAWLYRRLEHFSGYNVVVDRSDDGSALDGRTSK
jgi:hypothetical protein